MTSVRRSLVGGSRFALLLLVLSLPNMFARPQKAGQTKRALRQERPNGSCSHSNFLIGSLCQAQ